MRKPYRGDPVRERATWGNPGSGDAPVHCTPVRVDQVIPSLASRDAIGVHTINLRDGLRQVGIDSDIFYGSFTPDVQHEGRPVTELGRAGRDRWLLYQSSIGSPVYDILAARPERKLVNYHNITPAAPAARLGAQRGLRGRPGPHTAGPVGPAEPVSPWPTPPSTSRSCMRSATTTPPWCRSSSTCTTRARSPTPH